MLVCKTTAVVHMYLKRCSVSPDTGEMQLNHKEALHLLLQAWLQPTPKGASSQPQPRPDPIPLISSAHHQHSPSWGSSSQKQMVATMSQDVEVSCGTAQGP